MGNESGGKRNTNPPIRDGGRLASKEGGKPLSEGKNQRKVGIRQKPTQTGITGKKEKRGERGRTLPWAVGKRNAERVT